jgi:xylan 1,4-beta-xylosidase
LDFITFHAKGSPKLVNGMVQMNLGTQLRDISKGFEIVASYAKLKKLPIIVGESDPEGCAACSEADYPQNAYRNGTMYSSYTAAAFARKYELADHFGINLFGAVTWGFEFEEQPWFAGFRDMATNGVDKPVLNVFRMYGLMGGERVEVEQENLAYNYLTVRDGSVRGIQPDINALAARKEHSATVMVWNYHDNNDLKVPDSPITLDLSGIPEGRVMMEHFRIDQRHSNAYTIWKEMGSPQPPSPDQVKILEKAGQLQLLTSPEWVNTNNGMAKIQMNMPRQAVSLIRLSW